MSSIASLGRAISGLNASQRGLQVTGHNLTNLNTKGYTRQQLLQHDSSYINVGVAGSLQQVGLGVTVSEIRQVRDEFVDKRLRTETSVLNFYQVKQDTMTEIEAILDEPHGETLSGIMEDFWKQGQKLATNPSGVEERLAFIQTADVLLKRANQIFDGLSTYQHHLNTQVKESVKRINQITKDIKAYNDIISKSEISGDNANDYRDQRNVLLDELSEYMDISYSETPDGRISVYSNGRSLVDGEFVTEIGLEYLDNGSGFVTPVWSDTKDPIFQLNSQVNSTTGGDSGKLVGLLIARGEDVAGINTDWKDIALNDNKSVDASGNSYIIPKIQKQLAELIDGMTDMVNDVLTGKGIDGNQGVPVFVPIKGTDGRIMTKNELNNLYNTSAHSLSVMLKDLPKPMVGVDEHGNKVGGTEYQGMLDAHTQMMDSYEAYLKASPTDANYQELKAAHEAAVGAYEASRTTYEQKIEGLELVEDATLGDAYSQNQERLEKELKCLFTPDNMQVNPELLKDGGYNHLGTVGGNASDIGDNSLVTEMLEEWSKPRPWPQGAAGDKTAPKYKEASFMDCYAEVVTNIGSDGFEYKGKVKEKYTLVNNTLNERLAIGGVSQDEELSNMLKYQYAYNASARMVTMLDGMMDTIINRM